MSVRSKPLWFEGQLIRPQHLQQFARWIEAEGRRLDEVVPNAWGVHSLALDESGLQLGRVALDSCRAVMPDGLIVDMPRSDSPPPPLTVAPGNAGKLVKLAVPLRRDDQSEVGTAARFRQMQQTVRDTAGADRSAEIAVGVANLRLILEGEPEGELVTLPVARIEQIEASGALKLSRGFIPPALRLGAHRRFAAMAQELQGMLNARADELARRLDPSRMTAGLAGVLDFALLQLINASLPVFAALARMPDASPRELYWEMTRLAGALATFSRTNRRPGDMPLWPHDNPAPALDRLVTMIRTILSELATDAAVALPLQPRGGGVFVSPIGDRALLSSATFVLAISAALDPERLRSGFPQQAKMGPAEAIRDLVNLQLPGVPLTPMPVAPREIPYRTNTVYFELGRGTELWSRFQQSAAFVLHVGADLPGLEMEFWAIRGSAHE